ncbi:iron chelate uptake ABC transporter family permease subunit [uncultured Tyzzerella sp.]|uniref:ABC transporter permease n=1 Tax=uncultured Tyzzerella sp. TaxID=2321398 RepID=UPI002941C5C4|nr:iron chelate uptake ABC transporter family permease subunit [uncultured Tyzzerella sp.]
MKIFYKNYIYLIILIILSIISIQIGVKEFSIIGALFNNTDDVFLITISRLPRLLAIIITGAGLSIAGLIMQTITNNKFVSPSTAGTMEWCRFGVLISMLFFGGDHKLIKILVAFIISLLGNFLFMLILKNIKLKNSLMVPLIGMMLGSVVSSITGFVSYKYDIIQNISSWLQGNFSTVIKGNYEILYLGIPVAIITYIYANKFTIASMGEEFSINLGINYQKVVTIGLILISFITSLIVVGIGSIPFVGLIIPNIVSMTKGDSIKNTIFSIAILGAIFVLLCDIIGRIVIYPYEISVSTIISVLGSIIFLFILFKKEK